MKILKKFMHDQLQTLFMFFKAVKIQATHLPGYKENPLTYRTPDGLSKNTILLNRSLLIGSCVAEGWAAFRKNIDPCDFLLFNNVSELPNSPPATISEYDLTIVQIPLRSILPETEYFRNSYGFATDYQILLDNCIERLELFLSTAMKWNKQSGNLTFVSNFMVPQQNPLGRMLPRYDLRNYVYFIEQINFALDKMLTNYKNAYLLDIDQISSTHGRRYIQNDIDIQLNHGGINCNWGYEMDTDRIDTLNPLSTYREIHSEIFPALVWNEVLAMVKTIKQIDAVKAVIVDLDDTLWRGVIGEEQDIYDKNKIEGWPLAFIEALLHLKRRGLMLAIASKNDSSYIEKIWDKIFYGRILLEDFAVKKINWKSKIENVGEILAELNILPESVVFIDDNPRERDAIKDAFPDVRTLGSNPYLLRQILLWSPETQVTFITEESKNRTQMIQAKIAVESIKSKMSTEDFLNKIKLKASIFEIKGVDDPRFNRCFELLNKTNQFNTTGKRWSLDEIVKKLGGDFHIYSFDAQDIYSSYGLVGALVFEKENLNQMVMSCRVVGLGLELAALSAVLNSLKVKGIQNVSAITIQTEANLLSRNVYEKFGFTKINDQYWGLSLNNIPTPPSHITISHVD